MSKSTTIYIPVELKHKIKLLSDKTGKPQWKIVLEAIEFYETTLRKPKTKEELPVVDKVIWYIEKLCMSVGAFKENPTEQNLQRTLKTIQQIRERLGVDTAILEKAVNDYFKLMNNKVVSAEERHSIEDEAKMEINMSLKSVLIEIIYKYVLKEEAKDVSTSTAAQSQ